MSVDFNWNGSFGYKKGKMENFSIIKSTPSPMMTGGVFAIDRENFWRLGGYDPGMYGWGGENFELSFKTWLCGGTVDIISCSHVAHLDRDFSNKPYANPDDASTKNMIRATEVWTDEYKSTFDLFHSISKPSVKDLEDRFQVKQSLNCKPFSWYAENVIPDKFVPDKHSKYYGRLYSKANNKTCVDNLSQGEGSFAGKYSCNKELSSSQYFALSINNEFRNLYFCAEVSNDIPFDKIKLNPCSGDINQKWQYSKDNVKHVVSGYCLTLPSVLNAFEKDVNIDSFQHLLALSCNDYPEQVWKFEFESNTSIPGNSLVSEIIDNAGRIRNERHENMCLDTYSQHPPYLLSQYPCVENSIATTQNFSITKNKELRHSFHCAEVHYCSGVFCGNKYRILMEFCNGKEEQKWFRTEWNGIRNAKYNKCLTSPPGYAKYGETLLALPCDESIDQVWKFE